MTVSKTSRLALTTWSADTDPFTREDQVANIDQLEQLVAIDRQGLATARPTATPALRGTYYYSTDTGNLWRCDGTTWALVAATKTSAASSVAVGPGWANAAGVDAATARWRNNVVKINGALVATTTTPDAQAAPIPNGVPAPLGAVDSYGTAVVVTPVATSQPLLRCYVDTATGNVAILRVGGAPWVAGMTVTYAITYIV